MISYDINRSARRFKQSKMMQLSKGIVEAVIAGERVCSKQVAIRNRKVVGSTPMGGSIKISGLRATQ